MRATFIVGVDQDSPGGASRQKAVRFSSLKNACTPVKLR